ncbi:PAAR domain-containing protein [Burkholderia vietnamiensis]|nr:PAAR domain-containing protein [Burkholderia vietnamiensis]
MSQRALLRKGDESSAGGVVLEGIENVRHYGVARTFVGAEVFCPACNSIGYIEAQGQRLPMSMFGKEQALEDDICRCKCDPPPRMIASQHTAVQNFDSAIQAARSPAGNSGYGIAAGAAVVGTATAWASTSAPASAAPTSAAEPSTLLGDAQPFEYSADAPANGAFDVAAGGYTLTPEQQEDCMGRWEKDQDDCYTFAKMMGGSRGVAMCLDKARFRYNLCMGYTRPL